MKREKMFAALILGIVFIVSILVWVYGSFLGYMIGAAPGIFLYFHGWWRWKTWYWIGHGF